MRKADWFGKLRAALGRKQRQEIGAAMICVEEEAPAAGGGPLVVGRWWWAAVVAAHCHSVYARTPALMAHG